MAKTLREIQVATTSLFPDLDGHRSAALWAEPLLQDLTYLPKPSHDQLAGGLLDIEKEKTGDVIITHQDGHHYEGKVKRPSVDEHEVKAWMKEVAKTVRAPVIKRMGLEERLPSGDFREPTYGRGNVLERYIDTLALMGLNHGEREYFSQDLLLKDLALLKKAIVTQTSGGEKLIKKADEETNKELAVYRAVRQADSIIKEHARSSPHLNGVLRGHAIYHAQCAIGIKNGFLDHILNPTQLLKREFKDRGADDIIAAINKAMAPYLPTPPQKQPGGRWDL